MNLIVKLRNGRRYAIKLDQADDILGALDKFLTQSKITLTDVKTINIRHATQEGDVSMRVAEATRKALEFGIRWRYHR